jgi:hypothetical protein
MNRVFCRSVVTLGVTALAVAMQWGLSVQSVRAGFVTSADFHIAYGASVNGDNAWSTDETAGINSPTTQGDFVFSLAPVGAKFSGGGPTFVNGVLADGVYDAGNGSIPVSGWVGVGSGFTVPITAQYTGTAPANASSTPNYRLELEITSLRIWASDARASGSVADGWMAWSETTPGHTADQDWGAQVPYASAPFSSASSYAQVAWDPSDYSAPLAGLNDSSTRTFGARFATGGTDYRLGDGLEVFGRVHLIYNAVPEPSVVVLLGTGIFGLLAYAWRKR